jgi:hypothetical protein
MPCPSPIQPQDGLAQPQPPHRQSLPPPQHQHQGKEGRYYPGPSYAEQRKHDIQTATMAMGGMPPPKGGYQAITPIPLLGRSAAPTDCPFCGQRGMTKVSYEIGNFTQYAIPSLPRISFHPETILTRYQLVVGLWACAVAFAWDVFRTSSGQ